ncbi:hypothetical protein CHLRE_16g657750v5 [Chlamydomonas reinhardtii]|uniref:Uncharacterized protein n=1 Tax=Chlamydomonas reinhardtii TaxID=3055 RepID=A0A2K3CTA6_CHLRE|nr:uncharacterized protein CHLRE_16g657750v5 [Chlamydomonas reinhardtii]PNW71520.1 hypothetical protein CHLRE_16g657750v5 [Chlamydomonas reinhardtii]
MRCSASQRSSGELGQRSRSAGLCVAQARVRSSVVGRASPSASTSIAPTQQQLPAEGGDGRGVSLGPVTAEQLAAHNTLFTSLLKEYAYWVEDEWVTGTIPPELCGTYFRNGPGLQTGQHRPLEELLSQAKSLSRLCHQFGGTSASGGLASSGLSSRTFAEGATVHSSSGAANSTGGRNFSRASSSKAASGAAAPSPSSFGAAAESAAQPDDGAGGGAASLIRATRLRDVSPAATAAAPRYLASPAGSPAMQGRMSYLGDSGARSVELPVFRRASNGGLKLAAAVAAAAAAGEAAGIAGAQSPTALSGAASPFGTRSRHALFQGAGLGSPSSGGLAASPGGGGGGGSGAGSPLGSAAVTSLGGSSKKSNVIQWNEHGGGSNRALRSATPLPPPPLPQHLYSGLRPVQPLPHAPQWQQASPALSEPHHLQSLSPVPHPPPPHPPPRRAPSLLQQQQPPPRRASSHHLSAPLVPLLVSMAGGAAASGHSSRGASSFRQHPADAQLAAIGYESDGADGDNDGGATLPGGAGRERTSNGRERTSAGAELRAGIAVAAAGSGDSSSNSSSGGRGGGHETHTLQAAKPQALQQSTSQHQRQSQPQPGSKQTSPHHSGAHAHVSSTRSRNRFTVSDDGRGPNSASARPAAGAAGAAATAALSAMAAGLAGVGIGASTTRRLAGGASTGPALRICSLPRQHHSSAQPHTARQHPAQPPYQHQGSGGGGGGVDGLDMFADAHGLLPTVFSATDGAEAAAVAAAAGAAAGPSDKERRMPQHARTSQPAGFVVQDLQTMSMPQPAMERSSDARSAAGGDDGGGGGVASGLERTGSRSRLKALVPSLMRSLMRGAAALVNRKDKSHGAVAAAGGSDLAAVSVGSSQVVPL